jgi:hypothetical protein
VRRTSSRSRSPTWLILLGFASLLAGLLAAVAPGGEYVPEPGELLWSELREVEVLPIAPEEPFTIVWSLTYVPCMDQSTREPIPEEERTYAFDGYRLFVDGVEIPQSDASVIPCAEAPGAYDTAAPMFYAFPNGLPVGEYVFEMVYPAEPDPDMSEVFVRQVRLPDDGGADGAADGADDGADGADDGADGVNGSSAPTEPEPAEEVDDEPATAEVPAETAEVPAETAEDDESEDEPVVVMRPERVDTGLGGSATGVSPALLLMLAAVGSVTVGVGALAARWR